MTKRPYASLLTCAVVVLAFAPTRALAQTVARPPAQTAAARAEQKPALKSIFAEELAKKSERAGKLSTADVRRLEKESLDPRPQGGGSGWSKKKAVLMVVIVVVIVGLAIVLAHNGVNPSVTCDQDPLDPNCVP